MKKSIFLLTFGLMALASQTMAQDIDLSTVVTALPPTVSYTVENDETYPWTVEDGAVRIDYSIVPAKKESWLTLTVTCQQPTKVSIDYDAYTYTSGDELRIIAENYTLAYYGSSKTGTVVHYLDAGVSTIRLGFVRDYNYSTTNATYHGAVSNIRFLDLNAEAIEINLSAAGSLGQEAIAALMETGKGQSLPDMNYLKLTGPLNSADWDAISKMTALYYIDMEGTSVTDIPNEGFYKTALRYIKFPAQLKTIGNRAFYSRSLRGNLTFPSTLESIGEYAFYANQISSLVLPTSVTSIGKDAFERNYYMKTLQYTTSMNSVPSDCFSECSRLQTVTGLDNVTTVNSSAFSSCSMLESLGTFAPTTINSYAFLSCKKLQAIDLSLATTIGSSAFSSCESLTEVDFTNLTSLGSSAFSSCTGLTSVTFNDKITSIPNYAFQYCSSLQVVNLGASVRSLGQYAFYSSADAITSVYVKSPTPPAIESTSYPPFYSRTTPTLYVPDYAMVSYKLADYWSAFTTVEANPFTPEELVLYGNLELTSNARIPSEPDVEMGWASSQAAGSSFTVNGDNPQPLGAFRQYVSHYKYTTNYDPCSSVLISRCANMTSVSSEVRFWCDSYNTYWYYVCMPFDVLRSSIYCLYGASLAVRYYDGAARAENGTGSSWKDVPEDGLLEAGRGYIFCTSKADYVILPATRETHNRIFTSSAVTTPLDENISTTSADAGWNLVGNPYSCFYDIYYMDYTAPLTVWNTQNKTYTAYSVADDDLALYPLQAFFVQKPAGVDAVTFQPTGRQRTLAIEHAAAAPRRAPLAAASRSVINLILSNGQTEDRTRIVVNPQATDAYDAETDASKMMSYDATAQFYSLRDGIQYAINEGAQAENLVQLGAWFPANGNYTIDATRADRMVQLYDNGQPVAMPYTFSADAGTDNTRFTLAIKGDANGIESVSAPNDAVAGPIFDLSGRRVANTQKGIYIINGKKVIK